jgi:hypothetical protein
MSSVRIVDGEVTHFSPRVIDISYVLDHVKYKVRFLILQILADTQTHTHLTKTVTLDIRRTN